MKIKGKRLFFRTCKAWLTTPDWKTQRKYMWWSVACNFLCVVMGIVLHEWFMCVWGILLSSFVMCFNWLTYIRHIEHDFEFYLKGINNSNIKGGKK